MKRCKHRRSLPWPLVSRFPPYALSWWLLFLSINCVAIILQGTTVDASLVASTPAATHALLASNNSRPESTSSLPPSTAPESLIPLIPSSPLYPFLPIGPVSEPTKGLCNLNFSSVNQTLHRTAGDCTAPLAVYVGNVICCPQFESMLRIFQGELSSSSGLLILNSREAAHCLSDTMSFLVNSGANNTIPELCSIQPVNLTGGLCPVTSVAEFEQVVNISKLLAACTSVDPLKECCKPVCQPVITDAAVRLATRDSSSLESNGSITAHHMPQEVNDCKGVVLSWLASQLGPQAANSAFRNLFSCEVNRVCPLIFEDPSSVVKACRGTSPSNATCCGSLSGYISRIQQEMLITNVQALDCVTLFGSMLQKRGVTVNVYDLCDVDLKDFSLQVFGEQGCLLRAIPSDVIYDTSSGISFTCDLNDNIAAPWPVTSSLSSFPLCAPSDSLPALPVLQSSGCLGTNMFSSFKLFLLLLCILLYMYRTDCKH